MMGLTALALLIVGIVAGIVIYPMFVTQTTPLCENRCPTCPESSPLIGSTLPQGEAPVPGASKECVSDSDCRGFDCDCDCYSSLPLVQCKKPGCEQEVLDATSCKCLEGICTKEITPY